MEFGVLGPLAVWKDGRELALGAAKQRAVLAVLLLRANEVVPTARVIDELWGEHPPLRAVKSVQVFVSQLRKILGEGVVETRPAGYVLRVGAGALDIERFESLLSRGASLLASGAAAEAAAALRSALAVWRGPALADLQDETRARRSSTSSASIRACRCASSRRRSSSRTRRSTWSRRGARQRTSRQEPSLFCSPMPRARPSFSPASGAPSTQNCSRSTADS